MPVGYLDSSSSPGCSADDSVAVDIVRSMPECFSRSASPVSDWSTSAVTGLDMLVGVSA